MAREWAWIGRPSNGSWPKRDPRPSAGPSRGPRWSPRISRLSASELGRSTITPAASSTRSRSAAIRGATRWSKLAVRPLRAERDRLAEATLWFETAPRRRVHAAFVPALSGADEGQGGVGRPVCQAPLRPRATVSPLGGLEPDGGEGVVRVADPRIPGTTFRKPAEAFAEEPLGAQRGRPPYLLQTSRLRTVARDCLVTVETNRYSVPAGLCGAMRGGAMGGGETLQIYSQGTLIAPHPQVSGHHQRGVAQPMRRCSARPGPLPAPTRATPAWA